VAVDESFPPVYHFAMKTISATKYLTTAEVAELLDIGTVRVAQLCRAGWFPGARMFGRDWAIPADEVEAAEKRPGLGRPKKS
jgi:excisionase family DNA binding protein